MPAVFTPDDEPYLGRKLLFHFDQLISSAMESNAKIAPMTHDCELTEEQRMACLVIPQGLSIALSIRELIRQGYLFGAHVLKRALVERAHILLYLNLYPENVDLWHRGWHAKDGAPTLANMVDAIRDKLTPDMTICGSNLTAPMNSLLHAKPESAYWNLISLSETKVGFAASKILDRPDLCDELCADVIPWLAVVVGMMATYFPEKTKAS
jgi:hypothetical protein